MNLLTSPLGKSFGLEVRDVDLALGEADTFAAIREL